MTVQSICVRRSVHNIFMVDKEGSRFCQNVYQTTVQLQRRPK